MKTKRLGWGVGLLIGLAAAGCAGVNPMTQRGTVMLNPGAAKVFAVGPAIVHAYSQDRGGRVFAVSAQTGTDADCARGRAGASPVAADSVQVVTIAAGQIACIETDGRGRYELLWHARPATPEESAVAVAYGRK
jgi:hypothetical protein